MALKTWDSKLDFDEAYRIGAEPDGHPGTRAEVKLNYHRAVMLPIARQRAAGLLPALGWTPASRILVVGAGFGWLCEALAELGVTQTVALDRSLYIQANKGLNEDVDVAAAIALVGLNASVAEGLQLFVRLRGDGLPRARRPIRDDDLGKATGRSAIRTLIGSGADVLTESVLESLTDAECQSLSGILHHPVLAAARVIHYVVTTRLGNLPGYNWKTLEEWKALLPSDVFVEAGYFRVL